MVQLSLDNPLRLRSFRYAAGDMTMLRSEGESLRAWSADDPEQ